MDFEWDTKKRLINLEKHGVDFAVAFKLWESPLWVVQDNRHEYSEKRWRALGLLEGRVMVIVYTDRPNSTIRVISLRKANQREVRYYEQSR